MDEQQDSFIQFCDQEFGDLAIHTDEIICTKPRKLVVSAAPTMARLGTFLVEAKRRFNVDIGRKVDRERGRAFFEVRFHEGNALVAPSPRSRHAWGWGMLVMLVVIVAVVVWGVSLSDPQAEL